MTVQYYQEVLSAGPIAFLKLLKKWKGGVFKLIYMDFIVFSALYALISCIYRFFLSKDNQIQFEKVVKYVYQSQSLIPVAFILGFYVNLVFGRFWNHFNTVPWISKIAIMLASHINDVPDDGSGDKIANTDETRMQKRSIIRYLVSSLIITLSRVSVPVKRRFPTLDDLSTKGILLEHEVEAIKQVEPVSMQPFVPISWSAAIIMRAGSQGRLTNEAVLINLVKEIDKFRHMLQQLFLLDQVCVPLVYTQVVTLAVYSYFLSCLIGRQFVVDSTVKVGTSTDFYVPIFTVLQFVVYMGWLKLALTLVNPMGEDDEDFDLNCVVNYNFEVGLAIVDNVNDNLPRLTKDKFFDQRNFDLPLENNMKDAKSRPFMGSVYDMKVDTNENFFTSLRSLTVDSNNHEMKNLSDDPSSPTKKMSITIGDIDTTEGEANKSPVRTNSVKKSSIPRGPSADKLHFTSNTKIPIVEEDLQEIMEEDEAELKRSAEEEEEEDYHVPTLVESFLPPPPEKETKEHTLLLDEENDKDPDASISRRK